MIELWVEVEGSFDASVWVDDSDVVVSSNDPSFSPGRTVAEWLKSLRDDAVAVGVTVRVYRISHGHDPYLPDCECAQYETDHRPVWTFDGRTGEETGELFADMADSTSKGA